MGKFEDYLKKVNESKETARASTTDTTSTTTPADSGMGSKFDDYLARINTAKEAGYGERFDLLGNTYIVDALTGEAKVAPTADRRTSEQKIKDARLKRETGKETFITDFGQAIGGGASHWGNSQLSTGATIGLAFQGLKNKDNFYEPEKGSTLWKMVKASSAGTKRANELMEGSKEGRGWLGSTVMEVTSQAVENGIDAALKSLPFVGPVLGNVSFASRSFGGTAQAARDEGKSIGTQVLSGAVSAAIESITENMWQYGGVRSYNGKYLPNTGPLGKLTSRLEAAIAEKAGPVVSKLVMSFGTEAIEEMAADILNPMASALIRSGTEGSKLFNDYEGERWQGFANMFHDGLIGGLSGIGGGVVESVGAVGERNTKGSNALYAQDIRNQVEQQNKLKGAAKGTHRASIAQAIGDLFAKNTGKTVMQRASEAAGTYVSNKKAYKILGQMDEDFIKIAKQVADHFAENSFANEVVRKDVLREAVFNYIVSGEYANEISAGEETAGDAKKQIQDLAKYIVEAEAKQKLEDAKSTKDKAAAGFYSSLLSEYVNRNIATEQSTTATDDVDVTEARPIRNTMEAVEADRAARDEELHPKQPKPAYVDRVVEQEDNLPFTYGDNYGEETTAPTQSQPVQNDVVEEKNDVVEAKKLTKNDKQKINNLFNGKQKSVIISSDAVLNAIQQRAEAEGKDVVVKERKDGKRVVTLKDKATGNVIVDNQRAAEAQRNIEEAKTEVKAAEEEVKAALESENAADTLDAFGELSELYLNDEIATLDKSIEAVEENIDNIQEIINEGDFTEIPKSEYEFQLKSEQENLEALQAQREELSNRLKELNKTAEQAQKFADDAKAKLEALEAQLDEARNASRAGAKATADNLLYETAKSGEKISDAEFERKYGNTSDPVVKNITRWLVDNKDVSRFTRTFTENGKTTTIDGEKVIAAAMRYYLVSSEAMQTEGLSQEEAFEKAYEKVIRVMAGDDALFNRNDVDTSELESAIEDLKATIEISEDVAKIASEQAKQLEGEVNGEQVVQNNRETESGEFSESAESAPSYAKSLDEINAENRPTSRIAEDSNAFGWDRDLWDYLRRGLERLRVLESNSTKSDNTYEQLKNGTLDTGRYIYSLTDESGNAVGEVVGADAEEMDEQTASAFVTALKLCEGYDDVVIKVIRGRVYAKSKTGGEAKNVYGMAYIRTDGAYGCFVNSEMKTVQVHEPAHILYKRLSLSNNLSVADNALNSALTLERKAEINATYFPRLSSFEAKEEIFARLANRMQWFTNEEVEAFYNSLLSSGNEDATVYAKRELQIMQPLLGENKLNIDESLYTDNLSNDYSAYEEADNKATSEDGEVKSDKPVSEEEPEIQNKKGTFRDDVAYAVTSDGVSSVSADDIESKIALKSRSSFKTSEDGGYRVYVAYSQGQRNRFDDVDRATMQGQDYTEQAYTVEVYDGNKLVLRTGLSAKNSTHEQTRRDLAERISKGIGAYERGELKAVVPAPNGIGTKAQFKKTLDALMGIQKAGDINAFKNGDQTSETFTIGNYTIEMSSDMAEDAQAPSRWDKYHYVISTNDGTEISRGDWPMGSDYSPSWIIAEDIHQYAIEQGERAGVNDRVAKNGEVKEKTFNTVKSTGNTATATTAEKLSDNSKEMQEREERNREYEEAEYAAMRDEELWELRRMDKDIPTLQDFERQQSEQPKAERKASPSEGWDTAERTFGSGHKRATRVAKAFSKLANPFADVEKYGRKGGHILSKTSDMYERLIDVNDGFGTIKDVADEFATWRDDADMKEYWDEDVAARFQKILEDADSDNWTFDNAQQKALSQAYEEAVNAMMAKINNVNKDSIRLADLRAEAVTNKLGVKHDSFPAKVVQKWLRMQATTDTALKFFGGFKGKGQFYDLAKDIKKSVADRMVNYVDAYSYFDAIKKMDGFKEFANNTKTYPLKTDTESFRNKDNPFNGHEFTLQQIVTINRLIDTLDKTFEHSDAKLSDRIKGFVVRDAKGNSFTVNFEGTPVQTLNGLVDIQKACNDILNRDGDAFKVAREYSKACDKMFAALGKKVSATKKALTGNGLSLIGEAYTPVLWANEDGIPADFNFSDDDRIKPPSFLYQRTAKQGHLVVSDISYIVDKYIEKASDYAATAQIKDTLARLKDGSSLVDNGKGLDSALAESFGKDAGAWFDEYVKDLTQYSDSDSIFAELRKRMQQGALIGSPSVMMKQISSYWSAMGILSPEALHMAYRWKLGTKALDNSEYNKLIKYRGLSGNIDPTLSEVMKGVAQYGNVANSRVFQLFTNGISQQDFKTVDNLYTATMIDTYLKNQDKGVEYFTSGEFQNDIDSKFAEVMMRSQPMFDTELRAEYARTDNEFIKMLSMFRTQQTQNFNLIAAAVGEYNAAKGTEAQGEKAEVLRQTVRGQLQAAISLSLLSVAADFLLHGLKKYRGDGDDEDEKPGDGKIELGRILGRIGINTLEAGSSTGWGLDYLTKWLIDKMSGGETNEFYGVNFGPLTTMKNVVDNLEYVVKSPTRSNVKNVATNIAQLMGIPLNNAYRIVNSAIMWTAEATGNPEHFDDALKMWDASTKMNKKNEKGRNLLVESGLSKGEAKAFIKEIDVNGDGLSKDELSDYYISNPEEAEAVGILWDSMGWKQPFEKAKPSLDKKVKYNSNPLYAEMDADENESVTKTELMDYYIEHPELRDELETLYTDMGWKNFAAAAKSADKKIVFRSNPLYAEMDEDESESVSKSELVNYYLEHPDMYDTLSSLYKELGFSGTFRSAIRSAETTKLKETAEDAFYDNDYNALFESVSQMKNGKSWLTNMVKDEYPEYENTDNPLLRYITNSGMSTKQIDTAVESVGGKDLVPKYKKLRDAGLSPKQAVEKLDVFDANDNGSITQTELADYYKAHPEDEALVAEFWSACGWTKSWAQYKKSKKIK